jgi:regulator of RNase E activity RraA
MPENPAHRATLELQARWDKIRVANVYDALSQLGYIHQCLDLRLRPLFPKRHVAGRAMTVRGGREPRSRAELQAQGAWVDPVTSIRPYLFPGCVVVVEGGGDYATGKFGEMTSWNIKHGGAKGIVVDSYIRDLLGLEIIPDFTACAIGTSPVESLGNWFPQALDVPISLPGATVNYVRIDPGDWIIADPDGIVVVPKKIETEALARSEDIEQREEGMRQDFAKGLSFDDAFAKWGRA